MRSLPWSYGIEAMRERRELRGSEENSSSILEKQKTIDIPCYKETVLLLEGTKTNRLQLNEQREVTLIG